MYVCPIHMNNYTFAATRAIISDMCMHDIHEHMQRHL